VEKEFISQNTLNQRRQTKKVEKNQHVYNKAYFVQVNFKYKIEKYTLHSSTLWTSTKPDDSHWSSLFEWCHAT
jgi:hypothetical protein